MIHSLDKFLVFKHSEFHPVLLDINDKPTDDILSIVDSIATEKEQQYTFGLPFDMFNEDIPRHPYNANLKERAAASPTGGDSQSP